VNSIYASGTVGSREMDVGHGDNMPVIPALQAEGLQAEAGLQT
jgi:hypothetical protein